GRAKWKDYVDLYILLRDHFSLAQISEKSKDIFGAYYNEKLFREQVCYFQDIKQIKEVSPQTKVIMMTAGVVNTVMQTTIEKDAYMFLTKPFDLFQVRMLTKSVLEEAQNTAA
ncbi:MAG: hypothetical protein V1721_10535, partial [Pseudomonadota bacterium]